jgi:hypothetical protein
MLSCITKLSPPAGSGHRCELGGATIGSVILDEGLPGNIDALLRPAEAHREIQTVTGRLHGIDFVKHKLTMFHAPTHRALECFYEEDVEAMLLDNRRDLIQVTGQVHMDDNNQPREIVAVDQIWDLDLSPFSLSDVDVHEFHLHARRIVELVPILSEDEQLLCMGHEPWSLDVFAATRAELLVEVKNQLLMLWKEYAKAPDESLSVPALRVKRQLLEDWSEADRAQG